MGKTAESNMVKTDTEKEQVESIGINLPMPLPGEDTLYKMFSGKFIGIVDEKIIAVDSSLRELQLKVRKIIPEGKDCKIEYFEDEVSIYGSCF